MNAVSPPYAFHQMDHSLHLGHMITQYEYGTQIQEMLHEGSSKGTRTGFIASAFHLMGSFLPPEGKTIPSGYGMYERVNLSVRFSAETKAV